MSIIGCLEGALTVLNYMGAKPANQNMIKPEIEIHPLNPTQGFKELIPVG